MLKRQKLSQNSWAQGLTTFCQGELGISLGSEVCEQLQFCGLDCTAQEALADFTGNHFLPRLDSRDVAFFTNSTSPRVVSFEVFATSVGPTIFPWLSSLRTATSPGSVCESNDIEASLEALLAGRCDCLIFPKYILEILLYSPTKVAALARQALDTLAWCVVPFSVQPGTQGKGQWFVPKNVLSKELQSCVHLSAQQELKLECADEANTQSCVLSRDFGRVHFFEREKHIESTLEPKTSPLPRAKQASTIAPRMQLFNREKVLDNEVSANGRYNAFWVSHREVIEHFPGFAPKGIVWTPGLKTWQALRSQGIWVHGCADGLGEQESPRLAHLMPNLRWQKLAHEQGTKSEVDFKACYRLVPKAELPDLSSFTHFFWRSGSAFELALTHFPMIRDRYHGVGVGASFQRIKESLGENGRIAVFLNEDHFYKEVSPDLLG